MITDFSDLNLATNIFIFAVGAAGIWIAGTLLAGYADEIARRTGLGHVLIGMFLLAGITFLPEIATTFTAAYAGDSPLAVTNLLGGVALQMVVLAVGDLVYSRLPLTYVVPDPALMLQGTLNTVLLSLVAVAIVTGDHPFLGAGVWTWSLFIAVLYCFYKMHEAEQREPWVANVGEQAKPFRTRSEQGGPPVRGLKTRTFLCAATILVAGYFVARTGSAIAGQTGLGSSFMGMAFLALATSLPEISTVFSAMRRRLYSMAISDILGTNILNVALIFGIDLIAEESPVLNREGAFSIFGALLGAILTGLFLMGLAERRDRTILRMGVDSFLVLIFYAVGMVLLYNL